MPSTGLTYGLLVYWRPIPFIRSSWTETHPSWSFLWLLLSSLERRLWIVNWFHRSALSSIFWGDFPHTFHLWLIKGMTTRQLVHHSPKFLLFQYLNTNCSKTYSIQISPKIPSYLIIKFLIFTQNTKFNALKISYVHVTSILYRTTLERWKKWNFLSLI